MHGQTTFTVFLNNHFGPLATRIMQLVHVQPHNPQAPITNAFAMEILVFCLLLIFFLVVRLTLSVEKPAAVQQIAEMLNEFVSSQAESIVGQDGQRIVLFTTCVLMFILLSNLIGMVPGLMAPTEVPTVPLGVALLCFCFYHFQGIREQGPIGHLKHFFGPIWWISWLIFPIEIISHLARILSLTVRLYANMFAGEMVTLVFFSLVPIALPVVFMALHLGVALIQAYIFMLLTMIYVAEAVAHEH